MRGVGAPAPAARHHPARRSWGRSAPWIDGRQQREIAQSPTRRAPPRPRLRKWRSGRRRRRGLRTRRSSRPWEPIMGVKARQDCLPQHDEPLGQLPAFDGPHLHQRAPGPVPARSAWNTWSSTSCATCSNAATARAFHALMDTFHARLERTPRQAAVGGLPSAFGGNSARRGISWCRALFGLVRLFA